MSKVDRKKAMKFLKSIRANPQAYDDDVVNLAALVDELLELVAEGAETVRQGRVLLGHVMDVNLRARVVAEEALGSGPDEQS